MRQIIAEVSKMVGQGELDWNIENLDEQPVPEWIVECPNTCGNRENGMVGVIERKDYKGGGDH